MLGYVRRLLVNQLFVMSCIGAPNIRLMLADMVRFQSRRNRAWESWECRGFGVGIPSICCRFAPETTAWACVTRLGRDRMLAARGGVHVLVK